MPFEGCVCVEDEYNTSITPVLSVLFLASCTDFFGLLFTTYLCVALCLDMLSLSLLKVIAAWQKR